MLNDLEKYETTLDMIGVKHTSVADGPYLLRLLLALSASGEVANDLLSGGIILVCVNQPLPRKVVERMQETKAGAEVTAAFEHAWVATLPGLLFNAATGKFIGHHSYACAELCTSVVLHGLVQIDLQVYQSEGLDWRTLDKLVPKWAKGMYFALPSADSLAQAHPPFRGYDRSMLIGDAMLARIATVTYEVKGVTVASWLRKYNPSSTALVIGAHAPPPYSVGHLDYKNHHLTAPPRYLTMQAKDYYEFVAHRKTLHG